MNVFDAAFIISETLDLACAIGQSTWLTDADKVELTSELLFA